MQPPRGTLWLHAGTHKTGTSSIQRALQLRREVLAGAGIAVHPAENAIALANLFLRSPLRTTPRLNGLPLPDRPGIFAAEAEALRDLRGPHDDMVVSSEEFCMMRDALEAHALRSTMLAVFARIVPILFFRNVEDWRRSRADQLRKTGFWDAHKALPDELSADGAWYYDQDAIRGFWSMIGPVVQIDYDDACRRHGSVLPDFARAIGQPSIFDGLEIRLNQRGVVTT